MVYLLRSTGTASMFVYRLLLSLAAPVLLARLLWLQVRRRAGPADPGQRLGGGAGHPGALWIHGASIGELTSARPLIEALLQDHPDARLVITANTPTGRAQVAGWGLPRTEARLAPLDLRFALRRFRMAWRPRLLIVLENEMWPNRLLTAGCPVICVGARMSDRSFRRWRRFPRLAARLMSRIDLLCPQDAASAQHFEALGLPSPRLGPIGTLKAAVDLPDVDPATLERLSAVFQRHDTLLAASTHAGEDEIVLAACLAARRSHPRLKLILAPRHPARGPTLDQILRASGLPCARRATGAEPTPETQLYLADTLGEMALWYRLSGLTFIGGSLVKRGGHTPFEPAAAGSAILHGPHVDNFTAPFDALQKAEAAIQVTDATSLAAALTRLASPAAQDAQASRAATALSGISRAPQVIAATRTHIRKVLDP